MGTMSRARLWLIDSVEYPTLTSPTTAAEPGANTGTLAPADGPSVPVLRVVTSLPARASEGSVLTFSPSRSASGCASRMPVSSVMTTNSAPVRVRAPSAAAINGPASSSAAGGAAGRALMDWTSARTDGSEATVRASVRAWLSASRPSRS